MPPLSQLTNEERGTLLRLARAAIEAHCAGRPPETFKGQAPFPPVTFSARLRARAGVFVTLHRRGELRGCVGFVETALPLYRAVEQAAVAAASEDPRFPPLLAEDLPELAIEISVLSAPLAIAPERIQIGVHGLIVTQGRARGLLLPQVAVERNWSAQRFLEETCRKAGLALDAWRRGARVEAFEADVFGENSGVE